MTLAEMWAVFLAHANKRKYRVSLNETIAAKEDDYCVVNQPNSPRHAIQQYTNYFSK
jgi:hypothetical protein